MILVDCEQAPGVEQRGRENQRPKYSLEPYHLQVTTEHTAAGSDSRLC